MNFILNVLNFTTMIVGRGENGLDTKMTIKSQKLRSYTTEISMLSVGILFRAILAMFTYLAIIVYNFCIL